MRTSYVLIVASVAAVAIACSGSGSSGSNNEGDGGSSSGATGSSGSSGGGSSSGTGSSGGSTSSSGSASSSGATGSSSGAGSSSGTGSSSGAGSSSGTASSSGGSSSGSTGTCGTCASGFSCSAGGYCVSAHGVPAFEHVYLIMMENTSQSAIKASNAPYITSLMSKYAYTKNYSTTYHPSLPNYIDVTSGSNQGIKSDGTPGSLGNLTAQHLGDQLDGAKITWREYAEDMGTACNVSDSGQYATKHVPFLFYKDISSNSATCQDRAVDYTQFATDLAAPRSFSMISPNLCNDMHGNGGCPSTPEITQGDTWLSTEVPKILATPGFQAGGKDVLFIVWDEQTGSIGGTGTPMLCIPVGPLVKGGTASTQAYNHEALLATFEEAFGLSRLANAAQVPSPINDVWK